MDEYQDTNDLQEAILTLSLIHISTNVLASIRDRGTIRIGVLEDNAPYCTVDASGNATGFEAELAMQIGTEILQGEGVQLIAMNTKTTRANLDQENCDLLVAKVVVNEMCIRDRLKTTQRPAYPGFFLCAETKVSAFFHFPTLFRRWIAQTSAPASR